MDKEIEYVLAVAKYGSISKAANALYISQPSLSHYISSLEKRLGLTLFERELHGVTLTTAGEDYLWYAKQIQKLYGELGEHMRQMQKEQKTQVNVCLPISMNLNIGDIQTRFYEKYPQCKLNITCVKSAVARDAVQARKCSFAAGPEPPEKTQLRFDNYLKNILFLAVPQSYDFSPYAEWLPGIEYPALNLRKLHRLEVVLQEDTTNTRRWISRVAAKYQLELVPVLTVESTSSAIISARQQLGCCFLGQCYRSQILKNDPLKLYVIHDGNGQIEYSGRGIISLPRKSFSPQERLVYQLVAENLANDRII